MTSKHLRIDDEVIDKGDPWTVIEPVFETVQIYKGEGEYNRTAALLSRPQLLIVAIHHYVFEIQNGGHGKFYSNSASILWRDVLNAFKEMGLDEGVAIVEESARRMGGNPSLDRETRWKQLEALKPTFDDLDDRFDAFLDIGWMEVAIPEYMRQNREAFYL